MIDENKKVFSTRKRLQSFVYAYRGILYLLRTQHNAWIHLAFAFIAVLLGICFSISHFEWIAILICIGIVFAGEAMNTSIELLCDARFTEYDKRAEIIKDTAAGAVLIVSVVSAIVGGIIFLPKLLLLLR